MDNKSCFCVGDIVLSKAGRDKDRCYIVIHSDEKTIDICDGKLHKIEKCKKKNLKHIEAVGTVSDVLKENLKKGEKVTDAQIRREIKIFENK